MEKLETIEYRLSNIEKMLLGQKQILNFEEFCTYANISKSFGYKLTSKGRVPHYKPSGKMVYFNRIEVENWLQRNPVKTVEQIDNESSTYVTLNKKGGSK
jgi:excisionase family DNA binding protein